MAHAPITTTKGHKKRFDTPVSNLFLSTYHGNHNFYYYKTPNTLQHHVYTHWRHPVLFKCSLQEAVLQLHAPLGLSGLTATSYCLCVKESLCFAVQFSENS